MAPDLVKDDHRASGPPGTPRPDTLSPNPGGSQPGSLAGRSSQFLEWAAMVAPGVKAGKLILKIVYSKIQDFWKRDKSDKKDVKLPIAI
jgi:hypothetical protein